MLPAGTVVDSRYEICGLIGSGGMGEVYRARRVLLGDEVALKLVRAPGDQVTARERFFRESRTVARLRHPNIVNILDFSIDPNDQPFLVMEYLNGPSLNQQLLACGRFDATSIRQLLAPICSALQLAHERGVVHRDLKPTNIVSHRYETGEIVWKIIDFGLVDLADPAATRLTEPYQFLGTATYAAPEQLSGAPVDARTDLYSLGVIAFELLAGAPPFKAESVLALLEQHLQKPPPDLAALRPEVPPAITGAVMRCLAKDPAERWSSASALSLALLADDSATVMVCTPPPRDGLLGTYELGEVIARGRFGSDIHRGVHRALGHPVAIRLFRPSAGKDRDAVRARFLREAKALQVPHPYIVQVRDFGESGDLVYVVTDLLQSCSLAERFQRERPLPLALVHEFVAQLIDAAAAIHHRGGLICGLHPGIVRVVEDGAREHVAISSAGICSLHDLLATLDESALRGRSIRGTELPYVAPELLMGKGATPQSDLFTIGVLAYEMATGRLPFDAPSLPELIASMLGGLAATAGSLRAGLPSHEDQCITRCLAVDPGQRFSSVSELLLVWVARSGSSQVAR